MIRALAIVTVLAATATSASAGVYGSLGLGSTGVDDSSDLLTQNSRSVRVAGGYQFTPLLSAEGGFMGYGAAYRSNIYDGHEFYAAGLFHWPIANGFEVYGRLGLEHMSLSREVTADSFAGSGYLFGAGFEYKIKIPSVPVPHVSVWVDYTRSSNSITESDASNNGSRDLGVSMWTLGVSVGM